MSPHSVTEQLAPARSRPSASVSSLSSFHSAPLTFQSNNAHNNNNGNGNNISNANSRPVTSIPPNLLHSAPASPPTPAPSPTPHQKPSTNWQSADDDEDVPLFDVRAHFSSLPNAKKQKFLEDILGLCDMPQLSFVSSYVGPRLRKDPFVTFPTELCLRVLSFIDDPRTLARASQVSKRWRELLNDDITWKHLCDKHAYVYRRMSEDGRDFIDPFHPDPLKAVSSCRSQRKTSGPQQRDHHGFLRKPKVSGRQSSDDSSESSVSVTGEFPLSSGPWFRKRGGRFSSYRSQFKQKYMIEAAWNKGGRCTQRYTAPDEGVVTSLHLTPKYIVVALDSAKIHIYDTNGNNKRILEGHIMGVWAMVPWDDILVSGGCDREVRVWNMATGSGIHLLRGHTSTVRCLKMSDQFTAISGSRDTTLRVWDLVTGTCRNVLVGHQASVRCLAVCGDIVVSGSYDTTARVWSISEGRCLRTLSGHFSQIYAVAYDGKRIATGSLDTSVRIWDAQSGQCHAILQGHTSLVGQLQMRGDTLVTGGSDGSVRVWSLTQMTPIHRLAAHDNSVTSLQFDSTRILSGGRDGRVKVWSLQSGQLIRELSTPSEAVWRVAFEEQKAVIMACRADRTVMEVWSFSPPPEDDSSDSVVVESSSSTPGFDPTKETESDPPVQRRTLFPELPTLVPRQGNDDDQLMPDAPLS